MRWSEVLTGRVAGALANTTPSTLRAAGSCLEPDILGCRSAQKLQSFASIGALPQGAAQTTSQVPARSGKLRSDSQPSCADAGSSVANPHGSEQSAWAESIAAVAPVPPARSFGRIEHILVHQRELLSKVIAAELGMPMFLVLELLKFGAIYTCRVVPELPAEVRLQMSHERLQKQDAARTAAKELAGKNPSHSVPRRVPTDMIVEENAFIRVHCHPKRFLAAYAYDWKERIVYDGNDFVVANKPPCLPAVPTVDNQLECFPACISKALGDKSLYITSRLDHCTEGLLVLAKSSSAAAHYNHLQLTTTDAGEPCVEKFYRALSLTPPALGLMEHFLKVNQRGAGRPARTAVHLDSAEGARLSQLIVLAVERVKLQGEAAERWGDEAFESFIQLKTGRTHQIRAQLGASGTSICGDTLYAPEQESSQQLYAPTQAIGLQCMRLRIWNFEQTPAPDALPQPTWHQLDAGCPWWRAG